MRRTTATHVGANGQVVVSTLSRAQQRSTQEIPWTQGPQTRLQRWKRNLVG